MAPSKRVFGGTRDMTQGPIVGQLLLFSVPLMVGNIFQLLYNTVDVWVVGNYVSKTALAAVGSTTMIINMLVFFFNGFSVGAGVVIARHFGARDTERLHDAIETTVALTFLFCLVFTAVGTLAVRPMLRMMQTPDDVFDEAASYLTIYFAGIGGLLIYNIGSGILRAVGDTFRPLLFLALTSLLNIGLDLFFVLALGMGVEGVALATILAQFISAGLTLILLSRSRDIYRLTWKDLRIQKPVVRSIFAIALPAGIQSVLTSFSNVFVQSYINYFGSDCMAGWSCYNKLDQFVLLPMQSLGMAATTFVSQNLGAKQDERADRGTFISVALAVGITGFIAAALFIFAKPAIRLFNGDESVLDYGTLFIRANVFFILANCVNHVLAGTLRGRGDSRGPMAIMLLTFVGIRQLYLFIVTHWIANTPLLVGLGYPVGWVTCCALEVLYAHLRIKEDRSKRAAVNT